jgi:hypothetical protein
MSGDRAMEALVQAAVPFFEHMRQRLPKETVNAAMLEACKTLLRELGSVLAGHTACKTVKHVHKLCLSVYPHLKTTLRVVSDELDLANCPQHLQLFLDLDIPANLVKFMALALRAGYPLVPLPESAKATSDVAAQVWGVGADLYGGLVGFCHNQIDSPFCSLGSAVIEQLATGSEGEDPGRAPNLACLCRS